MDDPTTALQERIAESFCEPAHRSRWPLVLISTYCGQCWERSTAVLPIVEAAKAEAWDEGHSWGWSDAQDAHEVRQVMARADWPICTPNPYKEYPR